MSRPMRITMMASAILVGLFVREVSGQNKSDKKAAAEARFTDKEHNFSLTPPAGWEPADLSIFSVPGDLRAAWMPDNRTSITVLTEWTDRPLDAREHGKKTAATLKEAGFEVKEQAVKKVSGRRASIMLVVGKGTGAALVGRGKVSTAQRRVVIPRKADVITLWLTTPEIDLEKYSEAFQEVVDSLQIGPAPKHDTSVQNLDFEKDPQAGAIPDGWARRDLAPRTGGDGYEIATDTKIAHGGKACARIRLVADSALDSQDFGTMTQAMPVEPFVGKKIRYTGYVRTENVSGGFGGLWLRIDGPARQLRFDNMADRGITGTTPWKQYEIVFDVPEEAAKIVFGALLVGEGTIWVDDLKIEEAKPRAKVTGKVESESTLASQPENAVNLDFESGRGKEELPKDWWRCGQPDSPYKVVVDTQTTHEGENCCRISPTGDRKPRAGEFAGCSQAVAAKQWLGKRVRYSGLLRTKDVRGHAGLWMRVDGPDRSKPLAFDNMSDRSVDGTTEWKRYEVVLDVPPKATDVVFGALLSGTGDLWVDDLEFEEVGSDIPTTEIDIESVLSE